MRPWSAAADVMWPPGVVDRERRDLCRRAEIAALRVLAGEVAPATSAGAVKGAK